MTLLRVGRWLLFLSNDQLLIFFWKVRHMSEEQKDQIMHDEEIGEEVDGIVDPEVILQDLDKELGGQRSLVGSIATLVFIIAVAMSLFHLYTAGFGILLAMKQRAIHLTFALVLAFFLYPASKKLKNKESFPLYDWIFIAASLAIGIYLLVEFEAIIYRAGSPNPLDLVMGAIAIIIVLEATRRTIGWELPFIAVLFVVYAYFGPSMPGLLQHR